LPVQSGEFHLREHGEYELRRVQFPRIQQTSGDLNGGDSIRLSLVLADLVVDEAHDIGTDGSSEHSGQLDLSLSGFVHLISIMDDVGGSSGSSQDNSLPVLSIDQDRQNCGCGAVVQAQTNLLRQRLMSSVAYELSEYEQFMSSFLSNRQDAQYENNGEPYQDEIDRMLSEMLLISVNILISV
ncbi:hypothetical protein PENTCL1PPCAC_22807, partial [Pristionchus entomophagus]